jgi:hypothetical protein
MTNKREELIKKLSKKLGIVSYKNKEKRVSFDESFGQDKMKIIKSVIGDKSVEIAKKLDEENKKMKG